MRFSVPSLLCCTYNLCLWEYLITQFCDTVVPLATHHAGEIRPRLGLSSTTVRLENNALRTGVVWKRRLRVLLWTGGEHFQNGAFRRPWRIFTRCWASVRFAGWILAKYLYVSSGTETQWSSIITHSRSPTGVSSRHCPERACQSMKLKSRSSRRKLCTFMGIYFFCIQNKVRPYFLSLNNSI